MDPKKTALQYDQLAEWWQAQHQSSTYGLAALERALTFTPQHGATLDVGCGSSGRFIELLKRRGFQPEGVDISREMINLAQRLILMLPFTAPILLHGGYPKSTP